LFGAEVDTDEQAFNDVAANRWSYGAIEWAYSEGIALPDDNGNFRPSAYITRAEIAVMLARVESMTDLAENRFSDIDGHPDRDYILMVVQAGIFVGYPDGTFRPLSNATRYEIVTAMVRHLLTTDLTDEMWEGVNLRFTDVERAHWAYKYVVMAATGNIPRTDGLDNAGLSNTTDAYIDRRAQEALAAVLTKIEDDNEDLTDSLPERVRG